MHRPRLRWTGTGMREVLAGVLLLIGLSRAAAGGALSEEDHENSNSIVDWLNTCQTTCLVVLIGGTVGVGMLVSLMLFFCWRCCKRRRERSFVVTEEGLADVGNRAWKRLQTRPSIGSPVDKVPPTGRYEGSSTDVYQARCITYCLTFHKNGLVSGTTSNDGCEFEIHGHYCKDTMKYHWGETLCDAYYKDYEHPEVYRTALINGRAVHVEVEAQVVDTSTGLLEAHYFDSANSNGFMTLTWTEVLPSTLDVDMDDEIEHKRLVP